jgi:DNA-binding response OmpR family regulator
MVTMPKRVTLITRHTDFTIDAKTALERDNAFVVNAFASAQNALAFLQDVPQDLVVIDFTVRDMSGEKLIAQIRAKQPDIGIIVAPNHTSVIEIVKSLNVQAIIDLPLPIRQFLRLLNNAYNEMYQAQGDTNALPTLQGEASVFADSATLHLGDTQRTEALLAEQNDQNEQSEALFRKLAAEEPPMPEFEESATVRDLITNMLVLELNQSLSEVVQTESGALAETPILSEDSRRILATQILETAMDTSTPVNALMNKLRERMSDNSLPESERWVREPDFLGNLPPLNDEPLEYTSPTTTFNDVQALPNTSDMDTDRLAPITRSRPVIEGDFPSLDEMVDSSSTSAHILTTVPTLATPAPNEALPNEAPDELKVDELPPHPQTVMPTSAPATLTQTTLPTQMAVTLTQMSLETTADAIILTYGEEIIAYSGKIPLAELDEFRSQFTHVWSSDDQKTRFRWLNLPSNGIDYLLYSLPTENDFTLSLLFAGMMPITAIRRQGKRLSEALASVPLPRPVKPPLDPIVNLPDTPEAIAEDSLMVQVDEEVEDDIAQEVEQPVDAESTPEAEVEAEIIEAVAPIPQLALKPYSFAWLLRDPHAQLSDKTALVLIKGLDVQLSQMGWKIHDVSVYEDFVYLRVDAPQDAPPSQLIREVMRYSAELAHSDNPKLDPLSLWADSYLVIPSDREVGLEEMQDFINFVRS